MLLLISKAASFTSGCCTRPRRQVRVRLDILALALLVVPGEITVAPRIGGLGLCPGRSHGLFVGRVVVGDFHELAHARLFVGQLAHTLPGPEFEGLDSLLIGNIVQRVSPIEPPQDEPADRILRLLNAISEVIGAA